MTELQGTLLFILIAGTIAGLFWLIILSRQLLADIDRKMETIDEKILTGRVTSGHGPKQPNANDWYCAEPRDTTGDAANANQDRCCSNQAAGQKEQEPEKA